MADCEEIQNGHKAKEGDWFHIPDYWGKGRSKQNINFVLSSNVMPQGIGDDYERVFVPRLLKDYSKKDNIYFGLPLEICIWLPTQDQLQEMSGYQWNDFDDECLRIDQKLNEIIPTKEQAGLMVYMRDWHNKTWDGEKWI